MRQYDLPLPDDAPATEGALFDHLHRRFGWGNYDELYSEEPYWKWRQLEVSKIKRSLASRKIAIEDVFVAGEYCWTHHIHVGAVTWLYRHIYDARSWWKERQRALSAEKFELEFEAAVQLEYARPEAGWLDRLLRAQGEMRKEVYNEWLQR